MLHSMSTVLTDLYFIAIIDQFSSNTSMVRKYSQDEKTTVLLCLAVRNKEASLVRCDKRTKICRKVIACG